MRPEVTVLLLLLVGIQLVICYPRSGHKRHRRQEVISRPGSIQGNPAPEVQKRSSRHRRFILGNGRTLCQECDDTSLDVLQRCTATLLATKQFPYCKITMTYRDDRWYKKSEGFTEGFACEDFTQITLNNPDCQQREGPHLDNTVCTFCCQVDHPNVPRKCSDGDPFETFEHFDLTPAPVVPPSTTIATTTTTLPTTTMTSTTPTTPTSTVTTQPPTTPTSSVTTQTATTPTSSVTTQPATTPTSTVTTQPATTPTSSVTTQSTTQTSSVTTQPATTPTSTVTTQPTTTPISSVTTQSTTQTSSVTTQPATTPTSPVTTQPTTTPTSSVTTQPTTAFSTTTPTSTTLSTSPTSQPPSPTPSLIPSFTDKPSTYLSSNYTVTYNSPASLPTSPTLTTEASTHTATVPEAVTTSHVPTTHHVPAVSKLPSTTTTKSTTTTTTTGPQAYTRPPTDIQCMVCSGRGPCELFPIQKACKPPNHYCINHIINKNDGDRIVNRTCGNFDTCYHEWFEATSDNDRCQNFNEDFITTLNFECTYCCVTDLCNNRLHPPRDTLYKDFV